LEYKPPTGAYPLRNFHEVCRLWRVCRPTSFQDASVVKIWMDLLKGLRKYGGFKLRGRVSHEFSALLAAKLCVGPQKVLRWKKVLEVLYHCARFGGSRISPAAKNVEFFVCLSVCYAFERQICAPDFTMKVLGVQKRF